MKSTLPDIHERLPTFTERLKTVGLHIVPSQSGFASPGQKILTKKQFMSYSIIADRRLREEMFNHIADLGCMVIEGTVVPAGGSLFS